MTAEIQTVNRLQSLLELYRDGYRSQVIDQTVDKLISLEVSQSRVELQRLAERLAEYERKYRMTSAEFYGRFRAGELGDEMDFVEWSVFWDMHLAAQKRLDCLMKQAS